MEFETKIKQQGELFQDEKNEELKLSFEEKNSIITDEPGGLPVMKTGPEQPYAEGLKRALQRVPVKTAEQFLTEKKDMIRRNVENVYKNLVIFRQKAEQVDPGLRKHSLSSSVSQLNKRMNSAANKLACRSRIRDFEKRAKEEEDPDAMASFEQDCKKLANVTIDSFRIGDDTEFTSNLEYNFRLVGLAERVNRGLLQIAGGERADTVNAAQRKALFRKIGICRQVKTWMDAKMDLMKNSYYVYLTGKDVRDRKAFRKALERAEFLQNKEELRQQFLDYLKKLERVDQCALKRDKLRENEQSYLQELDQAVTKTADEAVKEYNLRENRIQTKKCEEAALKNAPGKTKDPTLTEEDRTDAKKVYAEKKEAFLRLSLSDLKCGSVEEILQNVGANSVLIKQALEMQKILAQAVHDPETELTSDEVIELRAKIRVITSVSEMQEKLLRLTFRSDDSILRETKIKDWKKKNGIVPIPDPNALFQKLKETYTADQAKAGAEAKKVWTILNRGMELSQAETDDRKAEVQKNALIWEQVHDAGSRIGNSADEVIITLKKWCMANDQVFQTPNKAVWLYMRGRSEEEMASIYRRSIGTPKERYLLYKEIVDLAKDQFNPERFDFSQISEGGRLAQDFAHRSALMMLMREAANCSRAMKTILQNDPELKLSENETVDEEWHKEASALSKFSTDRLLPMFRTIQRLTDSDEKREFMASIRPEELKLLFQNRKAIREWMNSQKDQEEKNVSLAKKILAALEGFDPCEKDLSAEYRAYRNAEKIDEEKLRDRQEYRRIRDMETDPSRTTEEELKKVRRTCLAILNERSSADEALWFRLSTSALRDLTLACLRREVSDENMQEFVQTLLVREKHDPASELEDAREARWEEAEQKVMDFFSALAEGLSAEDAAKRSENFRTVLEQRSETVALFLSAYAKKNGEGDPNDPMLEKMTEKMGEPEAQFVLHTHQELSPVFDWLIRKLGQKKITASNVEQALSEGNEELNNAFLQSDQKINEHVDALFVQVENSVGQWTDKAIGLIEKKSEDEEEEKKEEGKKEKEKKKAPEKEPDIRDLLKKSMTREKGDGKFITIAMKQYFRYSNKADRRSMANALLKDIRPINQNASRLASDVKQAGRYLGGMLKGAGPLFQKMMQGIPEEYFLPELRRALDDVKSNLAPIPDAFVKQKLDEMMQRSQGKVTNIKKISSLGAASVAETFLCRLYGPNLPTAGKDVVIKILRPQLVERLEREKKILRVAARCTDNDQLDFDREMQKDLPAAAETKGMEATHITQVEKILEELDMTIEVKNAEAGYETYHSEKDADVDTVKVNEDLPVMKDAYALDRAEGVTVERYLKKLQKRQKDSLEPFAYLDKNREQKYRIGKDQMKLYEETRSRLLKELEGIMNQQRMLIKMAGKWTEQAIFGSNFYHGDMHAGNIMISDNKVTLIDYGNATKLTEFQRNHIMAMTSCAMNASLAEDFLWSFVQLLPKLPDEQEFKRVDHQNEKNHPRLQGKGEAFLEKIRKILGMTDPTDPDNDQPGEKISLILKTAQEMGLQLPSEVENFSKSQLRLQNTIASFNEVVEEIRTEIRRLDRMGMEKEPFFDLMRKIHADANKNHSHVTNLLNDVINVFTPVSKEEFKKSAKDNDPAKREQFETTYTGKYRDLVKTDADGNWVPRLDLSVVPTCRQKLTRLKELAPKSAFDELSPEYTKLRGELEAMMVGIFADSYADADPLAAFGGTLTIMGQITNNLMNNDLEPTDDILSLLENEVPTATQFMLDYMAMREIQEDTGFFNFGSDRKVNDRMEAMYESYEKLQSSRINTSTEIKEARKALNGDLAYKPGQFEVLKSLPIRSSQVKGDKTKLNRLWDEYHEMNRSLRAKYFSAEEKELSEVEAEKSKRLDQRRQNTVRLNEEKLSEEQIKELEEQNEALTKEIQGYDKREKELTRILDGLEKKLSAKEQKDLKNAYMTLQKEYDALNMYTGYIYKKEEMDQEIEGLRTEEGGNDLYKAYSEFRTIQKSQVDLILAGKEVDQKSLELRKTKEKNFIECWKRFNKTRLENHYKNAFNSKETIYSELTDYMKVTGDVIRNNRFGTLAILGKVSFALVGRLKALT